jgi:ribosomal protein L30E
MNILGKLFGSEAKVKIMRLFIFNPEAVFDMEMISSKSKVDMKNARKEVSILEKSGLVRKKSFFKTVLKKRKERKKKAHGYALNQDFAYMTTLKSLLTSGKVTKGEEILKRLSKAGKLKLVIVAGVFTEDKDSRLDILVVGNNLNKAVLSGAIRSIEAEIGRELMYACFETPDFQYRLGMYDKLIRDVLDYPHNVLLDKILS